MKPPKVSIIMPIYNMEPYLARSLESLLAQSLEEIEVIAVNDGSTDRSLQILEGFGRKDPRVRIINKDNGGVSMARNVGIAAARGDYIGFVDPDDWVDREMYRELWEQAESEQADIVMCGYVREFGTHSKVKPFPLPEKVKFSREELHDGILRRLVGPLKEEIGQPEMLDAWGTVWSKLYRANILHNNRLEFVDLEQIGSNEDSLFNMYACYYAGSFVFLNRPLYHYWRANPASVTSRYNPFLPKQFAHLYRLMEQFLAEKSLGEPFVTALHNRIGINTLGLGLNTVSRGNQAGPLTKIRDIGTMLSDHRTRRSMEQIELAYFPPVWKIFFICAKLRFAAGFFLMLTAVNRLRTMVR
ncbi:glycosyltransferase family 2 protein [Paenibacillus gansuensis]|uniref:Glycosyltransferase family 2 protein n=1 Tax=Paenibacillus gansuensis TaxID=306542 RepID=A0ABW5PG75_9BACL